MDVTVSSRRRLVAPTAPAIVLLAALFGQLQQQIVVARSLPLSSTTDSLPQSRECIAVLVGQLRAAAAASPSAATSAAFEDGLVSLILQKYVDCVASAARQRSRVLVTEDGVGTTAGDDGEENRKRKQLELVINETMTALGATAPDADREAVSRHEQSSAGVEELRVAMTAGGAEPEVAGGNRPLMCTTVECLARLASTTFGPCMRVAESQCSALIAVLEAALQLRQQQQHRTFSRTIDVESKYQLDEVPAASGSMLAAEGVEKAGNEEMEEEQLKLLRGAIFARLRNLISEYQLWRSDKATDKSRSKRSVANFASVDSRVDAGSSATSSTSRSRRAINTASIPFKLPDKITPETQAILEAYLAWREKNGYGKISGRWG